MRKWVLILALAAPLPMLAQEDDRGFLEGLLEDSLSGAGRAVDIQGFEGALSSTATIQTLTIADDSGVWLTLKGVTLNWSRSALLSGRLEVAELTAKEVLMPRAPVVAGGLPQAEATPLALPELPVSINIAKLAIDRAELGAALIGQAAVLSLSGSAALAEGSGQADLAVTRLAPQSGALVLKASYANATQDLVVDLSLEEPAGGLVATALGLPGRPALALAVQGAGPLSDFAADLALRSDGVDRLAGRIALTRPAEVTQFTADLGGDIAPLFAPDYRAFFGPHMQIDIQGTRDADGRVLLDRLEVAAAALRVSGRMALSAEGWPTLAQLRAELGGDGPVLLPLSGPRTLLDRAEAALSYDAGAGEEWRLSANLDGLERPDMAVQSARITANGTFLAGVLDGVADLSATGLAPVDPALAQALGRDLRAAALFGWAQGAPLELRRLTATGGHYALDGQAWVEITDGAAELDIATDAALQVTDLTRFAALAGQDMSGAAELRVAGKVQPVSGGFDLRISGGTTDLALQQPMLDPLLHGAGTLAMQAVRNAQGLRISDLRIATDQAQILGHGRLSGGSSVAEISAEIKDLAVIMPDLPGAGSVSAELSRTGPDWRLTAQASAPGEAQLRVDGSARGLTWEALTVTGTAEADIGAVSAYAALLGQDIGGAISLRASGSGQPSAGAFDGQANLTGTALRSGLPQADLLLAGKVTAQAQAARDSQGRVTLKQADFRSNEVTAKATSADGKTLQFQASLRDLAVIAPGLSGGASAQGTAVSEGDDLRINATGSGPGGTRLRASGTVAQTGTRLNMELQGAAPLALANDLIRPRSLSGILTYDLQINGAPELASVRGTMSTQDARLTLPDQQLALENLAANVTLTGARAQVLAQAAVSSGGRLELSGPITLVAPYSADLQALLGAVVLSDPKLYETSVNGTVTLRGPLTGGAQIAGRLQLGQTELRVPNASGTNYADLPGLQHVNEPAAVRQTRANAGMIAEGSATDSTGPTYGLDLQVLAPDRIFVRGRGLDAELGGSLKLSGTTQNVTPQGRFDLVRGRLDILGKRLSLDAGQIRLQGAFDPFIRFVASTETALATASIVIEGQASAPELSFTSSPELPQDEVLALILFDKDISTISPIQAVRLAAAINTLAGGGGGLNDKLRKGLALDDLDVTTSEDGATEARAGKYLSENIYSEVTADTAGNTQINLNLSVNRSVTARGRLSSDGETGIGIFIEKDY